MRWADARPAAVDRVRRVVFIGAQCCPGDGGKNSGVCASGARCSECGRCRKHCICKRKGASNTAGLVRRAGHGHPRFHPVPVRPVFGPVPRPRCRCRQRRPMRPIRSATNRSRLPPAVLHPKVPSGAQPVRRAIVQPVSRTTASPDAGRRPIGPIGSNWVSARKFRPVGAR